MSVHPPFVKFNNKGNIKAYSNRPFQTGTGRRLVDLAHKGPGYKRIDFIYVYADGVFYSRGTMVSVSFHLCGKPSECPHRIDR